MSENRTRFRLDQRRAPIYEALERFRQMRVVPFDVPGHKRGRGNPELTAFLGQQCVGVDVNSMKPLDNLCHPVSVIREAEELAADAFGAAHAFLMVGGTTSSVQSMVLTACKRGDEIILPRNVHRSVLNALVLCGAVPVYVNPEVDKRLGISLGMKREQVEKAIKEHPNAVAVGADAVVGGVIHQHSHSVGVLLDGLCHLLPLHAQRDAQALIHLRVHIHRHRAAQHQRVQHAAVHVAGQNDLIAPLAGGEHHALHTAGGAAHH